MKRHLTWLDIFRLGLVQTALGAIVVLSTSTMNRVMVVELALPAILPGLLVGLHYAVQLSRPRWGYSSDMGGRRTPWILGGMAVLALGGVTAAGAIAAMASSEVVGFAMLFVAYLLIGAGVGASGTSLLAMLATHVAPGRRAAAASMVWLMMIAGFVITAGTAGHYLDPFSPERLLGVTSTVAAIALALTFVALWGVERRAGKVAAPKDDAARPAFSTVFAEIWAEPKARAFTIFVFVSMLAYSTQDLILEPFAGIVFGMTPGESTKLAGTQHGGVLLGMLLVAFAASGRDRPRFGSVRMWTVGGCIASGLVLFGLTVAGSVGASWPIKPTVFALGFANGAFAVAAIGWMMTLAGAGAEGREGVRMGLWGGAQAIAFALGGFAGTAGVDVVQLFSTSAALPYMVVFAVEGVLFLGAAYLASRMEPVSQAPKKAEHPLVDPSSVEESFDVVVVGGGPAGATAAQRMAEAGHSVLLLDKAGRIKPCGGAIPPRLIRDFDIPTSLLCAQVKGARIISPAGREVDMQIDGGYVGMVDREEFDEFLRARAAERGATRRTASYERIDRDTNGAAIVRYQTEDGERSVRAALVIGADGARSRVAKQEVPGADIPFVFAYHEIVDVADAPKDYDALRCDVVYDGRISPDFYGWVFPHGRTASIGTGSAQKGKSIRGAVEALRAQAGLGALKTVRREGAPIPMKPMKQWDNGRDVVLAGDAAGVVAPASGEGIYYAMVGGELAAEAGAAFLATKDVRALTLARRRFMRMHGRVFWILGIMQHFWYGNDKRRERFVSMCRDPDVQQLTWQAYLNKELVRAKPAAHVRIFFKDLAHLMGIGAP